jgi:Xaa-Pro dipeptidase
MYEYEIESLFQYYCQRYGAMRHMSYTCICATGENPAVLHYGHAGAPNDRQLTSNDMCLFDMGGEYYCYASDITCAFPVSGRFTKEQRIIYEAVLAANRAVMKSVRPGVSWVDMHLLAERTQLEHLKEAGLIQGDLDEMMNVRLGALFMPHGLGHMIGIDTHDVGGYLDPQSRSTLPGLKSLRTNRLLKERMCLTIEPGIYFNQGLLNNAYANDELNKFLNKSEIDKYLHVGGVRIEDDIAITSDGCELLTVVPRTCDEIEEWMAHNDKQSTEKIDYETFDQLNKKYQYHNQSITVKKSNH